MAAKFLRIYCSRWFGHFERGDSENLRLDFISQTNDVRLTRGMRRENVVKFISGA